MRSQSFAQAVGLLLLHLVARVQSSCRALAPPVHGSIIDAHFPPTNKRPGFVAGTTITVACRAGRTLSGDAKRACLSSGVWSGKAASCVDPTTSKDLKAIGFTRQEVTLEIRNTAIGTFTAAEEKVLAEALATTTGTKFESIKLQNLKYQPIQGATKLPPRFQFTMVLQFLVTIPSDEKADFMKEVASPWFEAAYVSTLESVGVSLELIVVPPGESANSLASTTNGLGDGSLSSVDGLSADGSSTGSASDVFEESILSLVMLLVGIVSAVGSFVLLTSMGDPSTMKRMEQLSFAEAVQETIIGALFGPQHQHQHQHQQYHRAKQSPSPTPNTLADRRHQSPYAIAPDSSSPLTASRSLHGRNGNGSPVRGGGVDYVEYSSPSPGHSPRDARENNQLDSDGDTDDEVSSTDGLIQPAWTGSGFAPRFESATSAWNDNRAARRPSV